MATCRAASSRSRTRPSGQCPRSRSARPVVQAVPASPKPGRSALFRAGLLSRTAFWALFVGVGGALVLAAAMHDWRVLAVGSLATVALVVFVALRQASKRA